MLHVLGSAAAVRGAVARQGVKPQPHTRALALRAGSATMFGIRKSVQHSPRAPRHTGRRQQECSAMLLPVAGALVASGVVEGVAAAMLIVKPEPFVKKLYGADSLDPLTRKYCRAFGVALLGYSCLAFLAVATRAAHWTVLATLAFYNIGASVNNALTAGAGNAATVLHVILSVWLLWCLYLVRTQAGGL